MNLAAILLAAVFSIALPSCKPPTGKVLELDLPIACTPGETCWIAKLVDDDPGPGVRDYMCAHRSENGHNGLDFALRDLGAMRDGFGVLAAAPGTVARARDGMEDRSILETGPAAAEGRECGNGCVIDHGGGWVTQYCHLRKGLLVKKGDIVEAGEPLGLVGLSGSTEHPHLHFTVRFNDEVVDPFVGLEDRTAGTPCGPGKTPLWSKAALALLAYAPAAIFNAGFSDRVLTEEEIQQGGVTATELPADTPVLVFWTETFGLEKDDQVSLTITGPQGHILTDHLTVIPKTKARWFEFLGKKRKEEPWPPGTYTGKIEIVRKTPAGPLRVSATRSLSITL
jgi:hypothetical protein